MTGVKLLNVSDCLHHLYNFYSSSIDSLTVMPHASTSRTRTTRLTTFSSSSTGRLVFPLPPANAAFAVGSGCRRFATITQILTSHKSPANASIFNRSTSRTNLLKPLETATVRIHKLPQPQSQPLRLNHADHKIYSPLKGKEELESSDTINMGRLVFPLPPANAAFAVGSGCRRFATITQIVLNRFKPLRIS
ncbi:hypothetical protein YC2023_111589 [Brassica napus]